MKKILNVIALVAAAVLPVVSCSIEIEPEAVNPATPSKSLHASIELPDDGTKVFVNDNLNVCWEEGDEISVFDHLSFNSLYRFAGTPGEPSGDFNLVPETNFYTGNELPYAYAVYPYSYSNVIECYDDKTVLRLTSPQVQLFVPGSFGPGTNLMVSVSEDDNLKFKNVCGYFVLKLYGDDVTISEVTIFTPDGTSLCGSMNVCMSPGEAPVIDGFYGHANYVTVKCDTPVKLGSTAADATEFWFVVPPVTMEQGFTARITLDNGLDILAQKTGSVYLRRKHCKS